MKKLILPGKRFKIGTRQLTGIIHAEQGMAMFYCEREGVVARLPFCATVDMFEEPFTAFLHTGEDVIFTELSRDDILLEDVRPDMIDVVGSNTNWNRLLERAKMDVLPTAMMMCITSVITFIAWLVTTVLFKKLWLSILLGLAFLSLFIEARDYFRVLSSTVLYDKRGHWVDVSSGKTSLNGGWDIPRY